MLRVFLATQCAWNAAWLQSSSILKAVNDAGESANKLNYPVARASANAAKASVGAAKVSAENNKASSGTEEIFHSSYRTRPYSTTNPAIDALNQYITAAADGYTDALQQSSKLVYDMVRYNERRYFRSKMAFGFVG